MKTNVFAILTVLTALSLSSCQNIPVTDIAVDLEEARSNQQTFPLLSEKYPSLKRPTAYAIQRLYVRERIGNEKIAGYKAALTSAGARKQLNADRAATGVLFGTGWKDSGVTIRASEFQYPLIETEIGYVIKKPILDKLRSVSDVRSYIYGVVPAIEIPDLGYKSLEAVKLEDFVATNSASASFILGDPVGVKYLDTNTTTVSLRKNGQVINTGVGSDAMGNQWEALYWLINHIIDQGYTIGEGQVLLTGALGEVLPCEPGSYEADFGNVGTVSFTVR
jgi:2-keto-4-pentenoate hydratase